MAIPLFSELNNRAQPVSMQSALAQLKSNPEQFIKQAGFNVPQNCVGNPQATVMHLLQTGQVGGGVMQSIQPMLNMLMGKR